MAKFVEWDEGLAKQWDDWVAGRPDVVKEMCVAHPPNVLYKLKTTKQLVTLMSYFEDGTVQVFVDPKFNPTRLFTGHAVFGINPEDLEEVDLPEGMVAEKRSIH